MKRFACAMAAAAVLGGCAHFDQQFVAGPTLQIVTVRIVWRGEGAWPCRPEHVACVDRVGRFNGDLVTIYAPRPTSFSDERVRYLGHELMHGLGTAHE